MSPSNSTSLTLEARVPDLSLPPHAESPSSKAYPWQDHKLTKVLRWCGGIILAAAAAAFMYQGIYSFTPMTRHWIMLAVCLLLGLCGMLTGNLLKEEKGARLFLGLAAASFPVLGSQLGAMYYSIFGLPPVGMPAPLVFTMADSGVLLFATVLTLAIVLPVSHLAFRILARPQAGCLGMMYALANMCMLIPLRDDFWASAVITIVAIAIFWIDSTRFARDFRLDSFEGRAARLMLSGPLAVMIGRSFFYPMAPVYYGFMLLLAGACFSFHWGRVARRTWLRGTNRIAGLVAMAAGWLICCVQIVAAVKIGPAASIYLAVFPIAAAVAGQSFLSSENPAHCQRILAALLVLTGAFIAHLTQSTLPTSVVAIAGAAAILALGTLVAEALVLFLGGLTAVIGVGNMSIMAFQMHVGYAWLILAVIGIGVMLCASLIETKRPWRFLKQSAMWGALKPSAE